MANGYTHQPVLLEESLSFLQLHPGSIVVDGTLGGGGHAAAILKQSSPDGLLIGLDVDDDALRAANDSLAGFGERLLTARASFRELREVLQERGIDAVDAVLLDLGVSSPQINRPERGFRFARETADETPLDMRMDRRSAQTAADLLRTASAEALQNCFSRYGELPGSRRLARTIVEHRKDSPIETASDLIEIIREARIGRGRKHDPATLVFQALRIAVNDELAALEDGLAAAIDVLRPAGRLVVISYHSLEDRIVKHGLREAARDCVCPPRQPVCTCDHRSMLRVITRRPISATDAEIAANPRARSARLRAAERLPAGLAA